MIETHSNVAGYFLFFVLGPPEVNLVRKQFERVTHGNLVRDAEGKPIVLKDESGAELFERIQVGEFIMPNS